ncbi:FecR/PupR family sigma factor regulator [Cupriavidus pampae]|uniref:FecR N-terminal domain-containing protein n=1 Tax=Cupriavidus pampae TaxID=659251 RepID=A0ABN7XSV2_9BURK|nr:DUF4880 domain-containing protein [Cupriavidus pampae]CAG9163995.1 hypothetical protein LMG32289_00329 [Cupriavidus pampae]
MTQNQDDANWQIAWEWVQREHGAEDFDEDQRSRLMQWLIADPAHRRAYDKASRLWLIAGLVPPKVPAKLDSPEFPHSPD